MARQPNPTDYPGPLTLRERKPFRYVEIAGAMVPLALGLYLIDRGDQIAFGIFLALAAATTIAVTVRDLRRPDSLTLDANGFRVTEGKDAVTCPWAYVQGFREAGDGDEFVVGFDFVMGAGDRGDDCDVRLRHSYGLSGIELLAVLTQWHARALGLSHPTRRTT